MTVIGMTPPNPLTRLTIEIAERHHGHSILLHLLIDQSGLPNIRSLWPTLDKTSWEPLLGSRFSQPDGASPILMDISSIAADASLQRTLQQVYEQGQFANCLSLLESKSVLAQLASSLDER